jgi:hypothetical protein
LLGRLMGARFVGSTVPLAKGLGGRLWLVGIGRPGGLFTTLGEPDGRRGTVVGADDAEPVLVRALLSRGVKLFGKPAAGPGELLPTIAPGKARPPRPGERTGFSVPRPFRVGKGAPPDQGRGALPTLPGITGATAAGFVGPGAKIGAGELPIGTAGATGFVPEAVTLTGGETLVSGIVLARSWPFALEPVLPATSSTQFSSVR